MMRILFLSSVFPQPHDPTRGIYCLKLLEALSRDHEVKVISPWSWTRRLRSAIRGGGMGVDLQVEHARLDTRYPCYYYPPGLLKDLHGWLMWISSRAALRRMLADFSPECILSYWAHPDGEAALRAARSIGVPMALIIGGSEVLLMTQQPMCRHRFLGVLQAADALLPVSRDLKLKTEALGISPDKVHVLYQGVDRELFSPGSRAESRRRLGLPVEGKVLLWVGRMVPVKGLDVLLQACSILWARDIDFRLYLIGDGPLRKPLEAQAASLGLAGFVVFAGAQQNERLPDWYRAADLTVLPSRSEGIPNVLRESLACGTPFVASRVGGIPEIAHLEPHRLVPPEDAGQLAGALHECLSAPLPCTASDSASARSHDDAATDMATLLGRLGRGRARAECRPSF
jgi:glycosyltransferase involved in cell wall biosynthesis